ncbi:uncharacterized protein LAJ45_07897 [Morchella importuna]|uniref:uncharacterized protein n=1 Tax=Morchella importuna TaxID=1174673 RepID=UPI001E8E39A5|nr:uncharacterized protein LAJ45_07897 [Morchella importuna]KAH8148133.1 hypothetical protein LAJ45_07897 [Morchella importuna]
MYVREEWIGNNRLLVARVCSNINGSGWGTRRVGSHKSSSFVYIAVSIVMTGKRSMLQKRAAYVMGETFGGGGPYVVEAHGVEKGKTEFEDR